MKKFSENRGLMMLPWLLVPLLSLWYSTQGLESAGVLDYASAMKLVWSAALHGLLFGLIFTGVFVLLRKDS